MFSKMHIFLSIFISIFIFFLMFLMKQKFKSNFISPKSIECGFNSLSEKNMKFSNQFFMISILFVIFDMELIAIMPIPYIKLNYYSYSSMMMILMMIAMSILMEWVNGMMEWIK